MKQRCYHCGASYRGDACPACGRAEDLRDMRPSPLDVARVLHRVLQGGARNLRVGRACPVSHARGNHAR